MVFGDTAKIGLQFCLTPYTLMGWLYLDEQFYQNTMRYFLLVIINASWDCFHFYYYCYQPFYTCSFGGMVGP